MAFYFYHSVIINKGAILCCDEHWSHFRLTELTAAKLIIERYILHLFHIDDDVPEIKQRALATVEAKFKIAGASLENLDVNPYDLVKYLIGWLQHKPVSDTNRVLQLLIAILNVCQLSMYYSAPISLAYLTPTFYV